MRMLLTSSGITNPSIANALLALMYRPVADASLAFVPTAANVEEGDKGWLIDDLVICQRLGFKAVDVVDIAALPPQVATERLEDADVIVMGGGCTPYLLDALTASGIKDNPSLWETRIYMGISAGSIAAGKAPIPSLSNDLYGEQTSGCLELTDVIILPHLNSPDFPLVREERISAERPDMGDVYALDDQSALSIVDGRIEVVSEGEYIRFSG